MLLLLLIMVGGTVVFKRIQTPIATGMYVCTYLATFVHIHTYTNPPYDDDIHIQVSSWERPRCLAKLS